MQGTQEVKLFQSTNNNLINPLLKETKSILYNLMTALKNSFNPLLLNNLTNSKTTEFHNSTALF